MSETDERAAAERSEIVPIHEQLAAIGASVPASAWDDVPPSDSTPASLWAEVRALRQQVAAEPLRIAEAVAAAREACAKRVEEATYRERWLSAAMNSEKIKPCWLAQMLRAAQGAE